MKKGLFLIAFAFVILANSVFVSAITGSMGNARVVLYPEVNGWTNTIIERSILVKNVNDVPINITLTLDENATKFIELVDQTFILESGNEKKAEFIVKVKKEGEYFGKINVYFTPIETKEPGVVLSSVVTVIAKKNKGYEEVNEDTKKEKQVDETFENKTKESNEPKNNLMIFLTITTLILFLVLVFLFYLSSKKGRRIKQKKRRQDK